MKTYVVTGVSRGLGNAVARQLLVDGSKVYGTYNAHSGPAEQLKTEFPNLEITKVDMSDDGSLATYIDSLKGIKIDGIVNSAGVFLDIDFNDFDKASFEDTFRINTFSPLYLVNGLAGNLMDGASIVNISSTDAFMGSIAGIAYSASKSALISITQSLTNILTRQKVRSNAVAIGWMGDGMDAPAELLAIAKDLNPLKKIASYDEVANVVTFLLSDKSTYINGETITVDGGDMATSYILQKEAEFLA